ncbi:phage tail tape measure protein [Alicyclobacillus contaminans]|uniref:hypothetical protein n=1 Tax=Alicyclobacillus contaminans TaxID=392016 RepID=UPI00041B0E4F|nr:hypothetical protein [Alicyclobacillus contaminans]GMA51823.1 phage tail tape measure protein [Alicyclobacillus contaminans]
MPGSIYELDVVVRLRDIYSKQLSLFSKNLGYAEQQLKTVKAAMSMFGASSAEINKVTSALNQMARANKINQLAADMKAAGATTAQIEAMAAGFNKLADAQERLASAKSLMLKGGLTAAAGVGLAATMIEPIKNAADLQKAMTQVQIATHANAAQIKQLTSNAMLGGLDTGLSSVMVSEVQSAMSKSGLPLNALLNKTVFDQYLKFSDLLYQRDGTPVDESAAAAVQMSHEYQLYSDPKKLADFQNRLWKTLAVTHEGIQPYQQIFSFFAGTANRLGINADDALAMESFLVRSGLAGNGRSGGADIKDFLQRAATPATDTAAALMKKYGLINKNGQSVFFQNGKFVGLDKMIDIMQQFSARFHGNKAAEIQAITKIWGQQGGQYALALSGVNAKEMNALLQKQIGAVPSIEQSQAMQMNTISGQMQRLKVGWQDMMTGLGMPQLSSALNFLKTINSIVTKIVQFELVHPAMMKMAGDFVKLASVALLFRGSLMAIGGAAKAMNTMFTFTKLFGDFAKLSSTAKFLVHDFGILGGTSKIVGRSIGILAGWIGRITGLTRVWAAVQMVANVAMRMSPVGWIITGISALIAVIALLVTHWKTVVSWLQKAWEWFKNLGVGAQVAIAAIMPIIGLPALIIAHWKQIETFFGNLGREALSWGKNIVLGLWNGISGMVGWFVSKISGFVNKCITGPVKSLLGIHSPSKVFQEFGGYLAQGLAIGMTNNAHLVSHAANHLSNATVPTSIGSVMRSVGGITHRGGDIHIHEGAIQINGYGKDKRELAQEVVAQLGGLARMHNMSNGIRSNKLAFGHM